MLQLPLTAFRALLSGHWLSWPTLDLLKIKQNLGYVDPRYGLKECELCDNDGWRPGVSCAVPPREEKLVSPDPEAEALVQTLTDQILATLNK